MKRTILLRGNSHETKNFASLSALLGGFCCLRGAQVQWKSALICTAYLPFYHVFGWKS
jgi:hypothetical protein